MKQAYLSAPSAAVLLTLCGCGSDHTPPFVPTDVFECENLDLANSGWKLADRPCDIDGVLYPPEVCPLQFVQPDHFVACIDASIDGFPPAEWQAHVDAIKDLCILDCLDLREFPGYPRVCEKSNLGAVLPLEGLHCAKAVPLNQDPNALHLDWIPGGDLDGRPPVLCDLNTTCCGDFDADICRYTSSAAMTSVKGKGGDYLGESSAATGLTIVTPGSFDAEPLNVEAEYSAKECDESTCPFYLGHLMASGVGRAWNIDIEGVEKEIKDPQVDLIQPVIGVWSRLDGKVAFQAGSLRLRIRLTVHGPAIQTGDGDYDVEAVNESTALGIFEAGALSVDAAFDLGVGMGSLHIELQPVRHPPVALVSVPAQVGCNSPAGATILPSYNASFDPDGGPIRSLLLLDGLASHAGAILTIGDHELAVYTENAAGAARLSSAVQFEVVNTATSIACPADIVVECAAPGGAAATHPQIAAFLGGATVASACGPAPQITNDAGPFFPLGATAVHFTAGNAAPCQAVVTVRDTTPPAILVGATPASLAPPNHQLVNVTTQVAVADLCDPHPAFELAATTSDEPDNGLGDGDTPGDVIGATAGTPDTQLQLRAERSGTGTGRTYTIRYAGVDASGNRAYASGTVFVPH